MSGRLVYADPHARCAHRRYKLTCEEYDELVRTNDGRCAICGTAIARLLVDHDHSIGRWAVRGPVCRACNALLRDVDSGRRVATDAVTAYLLAAWHIGRDRSQIVMLRRPRPLTAPTMTAAAALSAPPSGAPLSGGSPTVLDHATPCRRDHEAP